MRGGAVLRGVGVAAALAAPPVALAVAVWSDGPGEVGSDGEAFVDPVTRIHTVRVDVDGATYQATLRPDPSGVCLDVSGPMGGGGQCGPLAGMRFGGGSASVSSDGVTTEVLASGLVDPEVEEAVVELEDGSELDGVVVDVPDRPERFFVAIVRVEGDGGFTGSIGATLRLLDADGEEVHSSPL